MCGLRISLSEVGGGCACGGSGRLSEPYAGDGGSCVMHDRFVPREESGSEERCAFGRAVRAPRDWFMARVNACPSGVGAKNRTNMGL